MCGLGKASSQLASSAVGFETEAKRAIEIGRTSTFNALATGYCGVVITRSNRSVRARGLPSLTIFVRPPLCDLIRRETATLRRPMPITRSGQGEATLPLAPRVRSQGFV